MHWHDAVDDSKMVVELLEHGARELLPSLDPELVALACLLLVPAQMPGSYCSCSLGSGSSARELRPARAVERDRRCVERMHAAKEPLARRSRRRVRRRQRSARRSNRDASRGRGSPDALRGEDGQVSLDKLVAAVKGEGAEARELAACDGRAGCASGWPQGAPALVEAPTGTGKSYALLAAALDWLDADARKKVVISTFTKQLQSQLAG